MFEARPSARQRCPSCGYRFSLSDATRPAGFGAGNIGPAAASTQAGGRVAAGQAYSNFDRMLGALIVIAAGAGAVWLGVELDMRQLVTAGAIAIGLAALGALMSGFWLRYENLSEGQRVIVDLPRRIVWAAARVVWGFLRVVIELLGAFSFGI
jgi:hypothetical protein